MSEKLYALLLHLYPARFRQNYGEEALQLFRDRCRDEQGLFPRLRLWLDLLVDVGLSVPPEYRRAASTLASSPIPPPAGVPSFHVLETEPPRPGTFLFGAVLALAAVGAFGFLLNYAGPYKHFRASDSHTSAPANLRSSAPDPSATQLPSKAGAKAAASGVSLASSQKHPAQLADRDTVQPAQEPNLDGAERRRVIDAAITNLREHYVDPDGAWKIADALSTHEKNGDYDAIVSGSMFADLLTSQMRDITGDSDLLMFYSQQSIPDRPPGPPPGALEQYRAAMERQNCTFEKIEMLPHRIGYLKLNSFPDLSRCRATAVAAMARLNTADAVIFDLRNNSGGYPGMVSLIASYLFDHPVYMFNPRENVTAQSWTQSPVPGNRLADKPVYVLTSANTFSGAEQFSYNLKMLRRATLVGETTRGGAHAGVFHRIDDHFAMGIPEVRAVNPYAKGDWEGTGVEPDVKVKAADALATAEEMAERKLHSHQAARVQPLKP